MFEWQPKAYRNVHCIVADPDLLGGKLAVRGTRISISLILECLANGMTPEDINEAYNQVLFRDALSEVLEVASETAVCTVRAFFRPSAQRRQSLPTAGRYRIKHPTIALFREDGRHIAHTVPAGAFITVDGAAFNGKRLVDVTWDDKKVMMFAQDLRSRAERVAEASQ
jgi:uncharacterized protein (DUF433 family)